jgi:hypothetical protein
VHPRTSFSITVAQIRDADKTSQAPPVKCAAGLLRASRAVDRTDMASDTGMRFRFPAATSLLLVCAASSVCGQPTSAAAPGSAPPAMPEWLAPFPQAQAQRAAGTERSYTALAPTADVIAHYQQEMRAAGVAFTTQSDGIGVSIVASEGRASAVVQIRDDDGRSKVKVLFTFKPEPTPASGQAPTLPQAQPVVAQAQSAFPQGRQLPTSPLTRAPYVWIIQGYVVRGSSPTRYRVGYDHVPTLASGEGPLPLPAGATIVDVFPDKCAFWVRDQAGHSINFHRAKEALGTSLNPGAWSIYPIDCFGIQVYLR